MRAAVAPPGTGWWRRQRCPRRARMLDRNGPHTRGEEMATVRPFRALRPAPADAVRVASPPYDVINTAEARALAAGNADSFLHVSRPEIDLPEGTDEHDATVYAQGKKNLDELVARGVLVAEARPLLYVYAQRMGQHRQTG